MTNKEFKKLLKEWAQEQIEADTAIGRLIHQAKLIWEEIIPLKITQNKHKNALREAKQERVRLQTEVERLLKHNDLEPFDPVKQPKRRGRPRKHKNWWEDADAGDPKL